jgi:hypothetical protein
MQIRHLLSTLSAVALSAVLTGCGGGADTASPATTVVAPQPAPVLTATAVESAAESPVKDGTSDPERKTLPNVVGMNLQQGQDAMQAAGFYLLDDQDASGQNRFQVYDRNWVVTRQTPAAGRKVPTDTPIVLYAKKYGE